MDKNDLDVSQAERIAVLETKVDRLTELLEPMAALYHAGKVVLWVAGSVMSYVHWDQIVAFYHQLMASPKH